MFTSFTGKSQARLEMKLNLLEVGKLGSKFMAELKLFLQKQTNKYYGDIQARQLKGAET